jgi:hypothetical protein
MPVTTIKRCQCANDYWFTVEDCNVEVDDLPGSGVCVKLFAPIDHDPDPKGTLVLSWGREDALMLRDALNALYPPDISE